MSREEFVKELEEILETEEELTEQTVLDEIEEWDSLSKLSLMASAKKEFSKNLTAAMVREFKTVGDICDALFSE